MQQDAQASNQTNTSRKGPPNRMNDLSYREWMKFQKSFFEFNTVETLVEECIFFFTKNQWPNGNPSRILVLDRGKGVYSGRQYGKRLIEKKEEFSSYLDVMKILELELNKSNSYDFVFIDFSRLIKDRYEFDVFAQDHSFEFSRLIRKILVPERYCGIFIDFPGRASTAFPVPWFFAIACRSNLLLRDEKIAIKDLYKFPSESRKVQTFEGREFVDDKSTLGNIYYLLFFQARDDRRPPLGHSPDYLRLLRNSRNIPLWLLVKSPPRKRDEKYHPAKFPEPLIEQFIQFFSRQGETILDPMAGTGSTLIAAARTRRNALGIDINQEFVDISKDRLLAEKPTPLDKWIHPGGKHADHMLEIEMIKGDATKLLGIPACKERIFDYCVTSPPYWSVLRNRGSEYQKSRRDQKLLQYYSSDPSDLGNIDDYDQFLLALCDVYNQVATLLKTHGYLTVIVKNVKRNHVIYPIAWDLTLLLCGKDGKYDYAGNTLWCQDDIKVRPFALGIVWVSNILHNFCLHFRKRDD